ncbi:MAG: hypothetical protein NT054_06700 [Burkholderiales bacterium]|nr:hypothetical protein [Burkholderiales bacterium]
MKELLKISSGILISLILGGCLASTSSPVGPNCNYGSARTLWDMPLACQGG